VVISTQNIRRIHTGKVLMATREQSAGRKKLRAREGALMRRKNINIDQNKLDRAVELLGADSEADAIDRMLDETLLRMELLASLDEVPREKGGLEDVFPGGYAEELLNR
jgi:hypothetical protein